ncbi:SQUAMOSA PROMOTER-BINDING-LIKE PROTEIN 4 [Salix purpurea]|uniref:SQUAMOSA PROMOTER-BINDING-LIKE PROTEIN 4 n=1 Tax=Salix purpurea TaxID=77065 RepID=A0A9Q0VGG0_SALPP|nr:SQUAMOSA PROMOTER-BINDING-LIKE PROTEIN 4 [Salix purpurea]
MDWNLKAPSWDLTEFEQGAAPSISTDAFDRPTNSGVNRSGGGFSIDLKLGRVGNSGGESMINWNQPSGSTKRARGANNGAQVAMCLVDGCSLDLSTCRDYHRRHKVCELHSKTPQVTIGGQKQRFCQQCSRFHSLEEFDEGKRSCRKRLDGHNRRRRKPQPDPFSHPSSFLSNHRVSSTWSGVANTEADGRNYNLHQLPDKQNLFFGSSSNSYKGVKLRPFLQCDNPCLNNQTSSAASVCQPLPSAVGFQGSSGANSHGMFCDRLTTQVQQYMIMVWGQLISVLVSNNRDANVHFPPTFDMQSGDSSGKSPTNTSV